MRHQSISTAQRYINLAKQLTKNTADKLHALGTNVEEGGVPTRPSKGRGS